MDPWTALDKNGYSFLPLLMENFLVTVSPQRHPRLWFCSEERIPRVVVINI